MTNLLSSATFPVNVIIQTWFTCFRAEGTITFRDGDLSEMCPTFLSPEAVPSEVRIKKSGDRFITKFLIFDNGRRFQCLFDHPRDYCSSFDGDKDQDIYTVDFKIPDDNIGFPELKTKTFGSEELAIRKADELNNPSKYFSFNGQYKPIKFIKEFIALDEDGDESFRVPGGATGYLDDVKSFEYVVLISAEGKEEHLPRFKNTNWDSMGLILLVPDNGDKE